MWIIDPGSVHCESSPFGWKVAVAQKNVSKIRRLLLGNMDTFGKPLEWGVQIAKVHKRKWTDYEIWTKIRVDVWLPPLATVASQRDGLTAQGGFWFDAFGGTIAGRQGFGKGPWWLWRKEIEKERRKRWGRWQYSRVASTENERK